MTGAGGGFIDTNYPSRLINKSMHIARCGVGGQFSLLLNDNGEVFRYDNKGKDAKLIHIRDEAYTAVDVSAGSGHGAVLLGDGSLYTFGNNSLCVHLCCRFSCCFFCVVLLTPFLLAMNVGSVASRTWRSIRSWSRRSNISVCWRSAAAGS